MTSKIALTIAGSDPSGGAGLQGDLKTFHGHAVYGMTVVSMLTVQNSRGVERVIPVAADDVEAQLRSLLSDSPPHAAKTGALGQVENVRRIAEMAESFAFPLVVDPVAISSSGAALIEGDPADIRDALRELCAQATLVTPNGPEASWLTNGRPITNVTEAAAAGKRLVELGAGAALVTGGHFGKDAVDVLVTDTGVQTMGGTGRLEGEFHGTGCALSAAITARLARGRELARAVSGAKQWVLRAMLGAQKLGAGSLVLCGPPLFEEVGTSKG